MGTWGFVKLREDDPRRGGRAKFAIESRVSNLVREVIQNVRDQGLKEDAPVNVTFRILDLEGDELNSFLSDIDWSQGLQEHLAACSVATSHEQEQLRRNLEIIESGRARILVITDSDTKGLTGPEFGTDGNFCKLCRNEMIPTEGDDNYRNGGAFGIGKSVLWQFSGLGTVIFSSTFDDTNSGTPTDSRFFGRTYLPDHSLTEADGTTATFSGDGYWSMRTEKDSRRSMKLDELSLSEDSIIRRGNISTGTTIAVLMYDERRDGDELSTKEIASNYSEAISLNFWPMIHDGLLNATVEWSETSGSKGSISVGVMPELAPFVRATSAQFDSEKRTLLEESEVGYADLGIEIPARKVKPYDEKTDGSVGLYITRISDDEVAALRSLEERHPEITLVNRVAKVRSARMVVAYRSIVSGNVSNHVGVLRAGLYHSADSVPLDSDRVVERFLRDSEPPAHDAWKPDSSKLNSNYKKGYGIAIRSTWDKARDAAREMLKSVLEGTEDRPEGLAEKLRGKKKGEKKLPKGTFSFRSTAKNPKWDIPHKKFGASIEVQRIGTAKQGVPKKPWTATIWFEALGEQGNARLPLLLATPKKNSPVLATPVMGSAPRDAGKVVAYECHVPALIDKFEIGLVASLGEVTDAVIERLRIDHHSTCKETK